jgi:hypothetical protein
MQSSVSPKRAEEAFLPRSLAIVEGPDFGRGESPEFDDAEAALAVMSALWAKVRNGDFISDEDLARHDAAESFIEKWLEA